LDKFLQDLKRLNLNFFLNNVFFMTYNDIENHI